VVQEKMKQYSDFQSSYDLEACSWSNVPDEDFVLQDDKPWVIGEFVGQVLII
jgi:beta-galactosidase